MVGVQGIPRTWETLFLQALKLIDEITKHGRDDPFWTFGGGTVLMLRYGHRFSKDIDIFVPDLNHSVMLLPACPMSPSRSPRTMLRRPVTSNCTCLMGASQKTENKAR